MRAPLCVLAPRGMVFGLLGVMLTMLTLRLHETRTLKGFFILTAVSVAGILICALLDNLVYGPFVELASEALGGPGGDEPVFFVFAMFVCPALFLVGGANSDILLVKARLSGKDAGLQEGAPSVDGGCP